MVAVNDVPTPTTRARHGRWLGGVCAGLAARWGVPVARVRLGFVLASVMLGLGVLVYVAAWLILPGEGEGAGQRGIVLLAQAIGVLLGLVLLAAAGAAATVFGYGWAVVAVAGVVLVGVLAGWARLGPAWALLPVGALVLPSVAMAVGGLRIEPTTQARVIVPRTPADLSRQPLRSGLGLLTVDLRHTPLPASGTIPLRIEAGVRRTLIALPHDRCVHVAVDQHDAPPALRLGSALVGQAGLTSPQVFGRWQRAAVDDGCGATTARSHAGDRLRVGRGRARRARLSRRRRPELPARLARLSRVPRVAAGDDRPPARRGQDAWFASGARGARPRNVPRSGSID